MSFLRHGEIYPCDGAGSCDGGAISRPRPRSSPWMSSPAGYSWQVALQQSPRPLHQPALYCQLSTAPDNASAANGELSLNGLSQSRGPVHTSHIHVTGQKWLFRFRKQRTALVRLPPIAQGGEPINLAISWGS